MDKITLQRIQDLHPKLRAEALEIYNLIVKALDGRAFCRFSQVLRTIKEQDALYAQGRTTKGPKVTNAKGGSSFHNYGLAIDIVMIVDGKVASWDIAKDWDLDQIADWVEVVKIFKSYGWAWGGDWKSSKDYPHFDKTFGYTWQKLKAKYDKKDFISGTEYVNI